MASKKLRALYLGASVLVAYMTLRFFRADLASFDSTFGMVVSVLFGSYIGGQSAHDFKHGDSEVRAQLNDKIAP